MLFACVCMHDSHILYIESFSCTHRNSTQQTSDRRKKKIHCFWLTHRIHRIHRREGDTMPEGEKFHGNKWHTQKKTNQIQFSFHRTHKHAERMREKHSKYVGDILFYGCYFACFASRRSISAGIINAESAVLIRILNKINWQRGREGERERKRAKNCRQLLCYTFHQKGGSCAQYRNINIPLKRINSLNRQETKDKSRKFGLSASENNSNHPRE